MLKSLLIAGAIASSLFAVAAQAATYNETLDGKKIAISSVPGDNGAFNVSLTVDGKPSPVLGAGCFHSTRPGTRYVLCSFDLGGGDRLEVYPWVQTVSGCIKIDQYVLWRGNSPEAGSLGPSVCQK